MSSIPRGNRYSAWLNAKSLLFDEKISQKDSSVRRLLFCGIENYRDFEIFWKGFVENDRTVDFIVLHTTDPNVVEEYRSRFSPDFIVLANEKSPAWMEAVRMSQLPGGADGLRPQPGEAGRNRIKPERPLSARQIEVLQYLCSGCTNREIAHYMNVQPRTVKEWLKQLYLLFFVSNRTELVARVVESSAMPSN